MPLVDPNQSSDLKQQKLGFGLPDLKATFHLFTIVEDESLLYDVNGVKLRHFDHLSSQILTSKPIHGLLHQTTVK